MYKNRSKNPNFIYIKLKKSTFFEIIQNQPLAYFKKTKSTIKFYILL